jgi:hypothetical protein
MAIGAGLGGLVSDVTGIRGVFGSSVVVLTVGVLIILGALRQTSREVMGRSIPRLGAYAAIFPKPAIATCAALGKRLAGKAGLSKEIRDRLQNHHSRT